MSILVAGEGLVFHCRLIGRCREGASASDIDRYAYV